MVHFCSICVYLGCLLLVGVISLDSEYVWVGFASVLQMEVLVESWLLDRKGEIILLQINRLLLNM